MMNFINAWNMDVEYEIIFNYLLNIFLLFELTQLLIGLRKCMKFSTFMFHYFHSYTVYDKSSFSSITGFFLVNRDSNYRISTVYRDVC